MNYARVLLAFIAALALPMAASAQQPYPNRVVRIVIGVPPGGVQDLLARGVAQELARRWDLSVIVENRPGATGTIAPATVAKAPPDGYTILMTSANTMETAPVLQKNLTFDPVKDFIPVAGLAQTMTVVVIGDSLPAKDMRGLVAAARARPADSLNYGSWGLASSAHLDAEAFTSEVLGVKFAHIPYKGGSDLMVALASGQVDLAMTTLSTALPMVKQGRVKAIAYTGDKRSRLMPDVPTLTELGYKFERPAGPFSFYLPAGTPQAVVDKIAADTRQVVTAPEFLERFIHANGMEAYPYGGAELAARLAASLKIFQSRMKSLDIKID